MDLREVGIHRFRLKILRQRGIDVALLVERRGEVVHGPAEVRANGQRGLEFGDGGVELIFPRVNNPEITEGVDLLRIDRERLVVIVAGEAELARVEIKRCRDCYRPSSSWGPRVTVSFHSVSKSWKTQARCQTDHPEHEQHDRGEM